MKQAEIPSLKERIQAFSKLGEFLSYMYNGKPSPEIGIDLINNLENFRISIKDAGISNPWFTEDNIRHSIKAWSEALTTDSLNRWLTPYYPDIDKPAISRQVAVIMAGNIPLVGMHDFLSTLISGHRFLGKLSSNDALLMPALAQLLVFIEPRFESMITFTKEKLTDFDAVIATGSNNTSRYFEYYFSNYPHIIRRNRNGIAVLNGSESFESMDGLASDICLYFGLGCRSISKIYIPTNYDPGRILDACKPFIEKLFDHHKYMNNYIYQRTIMQMNLMQFLDNGVILLVNAEGYSSPISVLHYEYYSSEIELQKKLQSDKDLIQCISTNMKELPGSVPLGTAQTPGLWEYADGVDTVEFLLNL